ncbi:MAG: hypothetical protein H9Q66_06155 [Spiroplasma ixodetis]|nr:hypothetical protein [Spiroplasma ixodetis]
MNYLLLTSLETIIIIIIIITIIVIIITITIVMTNYLINRLYFSFEQISFIRQIVYYLKNVNMIRVSKNT